MLIDVITFYFYTFVALLKMLVFIKMFQAIIDLNKLSRQQLGKLFSWQLFLERLFSLLLKCSGMPSSVLR